jgi:hypothetical protein
MKFAHLPLTGLIFGVILLASPAAFACSCGGNLPFVQSAASSKVIVRGKVLEHFWAESDVAHQRPYAMTVEIIESLKGQTKSQRLTINGGAGLLCRPEISSFPINSEWVFALYPSSWDGEKGDGLAISSCGEFAVAVKGDKVKGRVTQDKNVAESVSLSSLRKLLRKPVKTKAMGQSMRSCAL